MSSTNYIIIPGTQQKVYENSVVILYRLPDTKWILHCGYYTYNGVKQKGWYFISMNASTIMPVFEEDLVAMRVEGGPIPPYPPEPGPCPPGPHPPCPPGPHPPHPPYPPGPVPLIFTPADKHILDSTMITVNSLEDRDRLSSRYLHNGRICRVNDSAGAVEYYEWDSSSSAWIEATLGYRYMDRDEITAELNGTVVDILYSDSNGLLTLVKYDRTQTELPLTGIANHPLYENYTLTIPVYGKEDVVVAIPKGSQITGVRIEDEYEIESGVFVPALVITEIIEGETSEIAVDATKFYNLFSSIADSGSVKLRVNSETSALTAEVKLSSVPTNVINLDDEGLYVDISGKVDKKEISEGYLLVADGFGGFTKAGDGVTLQTSGELPDSVDKVVTANVIYAAIQAAIGTIETTLQAQIDALDARVASLEANAVGPGLPDEVVISTDAGATRSGYTIGGSELTGAAGLVATEEAINSQFSWAAFT